MHRDDVKVGGVYTTKISGRLVPVKITRDRGMRPHYNGETVGARHPHLGWDATNQDTGRKVTIHSAVRLKGEYQPPRCGICSHCQALMVDKRTWTASYQEAVASGRPTSQVEMAALREDWKRHVAELPCIGGTK